MTRGLLRARKLMAPKRGAMATQLEPALQRQLQLVAQELFPPRNMAEADSLAFGEDAAVPLLQFDAGHDEETAAACVRALRLIGTPKARTALPGYRRDRPPAVRSSSAQASCPLRTCLSPP